jgi:hypothetical protein
MADLESQSLQSDSAANNKSGYCYEELLSATSFRVLELLPGIDDDGISYKLHSADWKDPPEYEAVSYAWGDPEHKMVSICDGKELFITPNLHEGLLHLRYANRSRYLWADAVWYVNPLLTE